MIHLFNLLCSFLSFVTLQHHLNESNMDKRKFINIRDAAEYLNMSVRYIYKLVQNKQIPAYRPSGKILLFDVDELDAWVVRSAIKKEGGL